MSISKTKGVKSKLKKPTKKQIRESKRAANRDRYERRAEEATRLNDQTHPNRTR
jgi:hypothetical protein